jgi:hypothetical protein
MMIKRRLLALTPSRMIEPTIIVRRPLPSRTVTYTGVAEAAGNDEVLAEELRKALKQANSNRLQYAEVSKDGVSYHIFNRIFVHPSLKSLRAGVWRSSLTVGQHCIRLYACSSGR